MQDAPVLRFGQIEAEIEARVDELIAGMTLHEKIGQMNQGDVAIMGDPAATICAGKISSLLAWWSRAHLRCGSARIGRGLQG